MTDAKTLAELARLAAMVRDAELARVSRIVAHMGRIEGNVATLRASLDARAGEDTLDPARLSGAEIAWAGWTEGRLLDDQARLAALRVDHEAALSVARRAFGRADVLRQLAGKVPNRRPDD